MIPLRVKRQLSPSTIRALILSSRLLSRPGALNTQMAYAACALLVLVTVLAVLLVERLRVRSDAVEEF